MRQIREFRSNFEDISRDYRETFVRVSHDFPTNVAYFHFHSYDSRATFVRVSHDIRTNVAFIFSPDSREVFACFLKTVARPSYDTRTTFVRVSQKFRIVNSPKFRGDRFATLARTSHDSLAKYFEIMRKNRINFLNMFKTFATSSRLVGDT